VIVHIFMPCVISKIANALCIVVFLYIVSLIKFLLFVVDVCDDDLFSLDEAVV
jgi:hypothetical protein